MSLEYKVYINEIWQGNTDDLSWDLSEIFTEPPTPFGEGYYLPMFYSTKMHWRIDTYDTETGLTTTGDTWDFITIPNPDGSKNIIDGITGESDETFVEPDEDWSWEDGAWGAYPAIEVRGGGRYQNTFLCFSRDENGLPNILVDE